MQKTQRGHNEDIAASLAFLKEGRIDEAESRTAKFLDNEPHNAAAHNLRFKVLMKRREFAEALHHAQKALELCPENPVFNANLGHALIAAGKAHAALELFNTAIAAPAAYYALCRRLRGMLYASLERYEEAVHDLAIAVEIEPTRGDTRIALANVLIERGQFDWATAELRQAADLGLKQTAQWSYIWGRLKYRLHNYTEALRAFGVALSENPDEIQHFIALAAASHKCGDHDYANNVSQACFKRFPVCERRSGNPELRVVVFETLGAHPFSELSQESIPYARGNFIAAMPKSRIAYTYAATNSEHSINAILRMTQLGLVFNNNATAENVKQTDQQQFELILQQLRVPVINPPKAVAQSSREANAKKLAGAEGFIFPRTIRIVYGIDPAPSIEKILENLTLPIILRPINSQRGVGAAVVHTESELKAELAKWPFLDLYAIEFHDCSQDDGLFRRYRIAVIGGQLIPVNLDAAAAWNVHSAQRRTVNWIEHGLEREEREFCIDPGVALGARPDELFGEIIMNTDLDIYGFDFGRRRDGRLVVFEINSAMAFNSHIKVSEYPYLQEQRDRIVDMVEALFFSRAKQDIAIDRPVQKPRRIDPVEV